MADLYTKNGRPLRRRGDNLFSRSGKHVGRIRGDKVFDSSGRYAGTVVGDRVIYRIRRRASWPPGRWRSPYVAAASHRGHRLGTLVKSAMLWMREQESALARLDTWNVESNNHMIGINEQLGYHIVTRAIDDQKNL
jgi:hypothetical protein